MGYACVWGGKLLLHNLMSAHYATAYFSNDSNSHAGRLSKASSPATSPGKKDDVDDAALTAAAAAAAVDAEGLANADAGAAFDPSKGTGKTTPPNRKTKGQTKFRGAASRSPDM